MVGGVSLRDLAVTPHEVGSALVRLEDAGTKVDVAKTEDDDHEEPDVVDDVSGPDEGSRHRDTGGTRDPASFSPHHEAGESHQDAHDHETAVSHTLRALHFVLRRHMNLLRVEEVRHELAGEFPVVLIPLAEDVVLEEVRGTLRRTNESDQREEDERHRGDTVQHAHPVDERSAKSLGDRRRENRDAGESEENAGTTFYIEIPFQIDHNKQCEEHEKKEIKEASIKGVNVLLAEDNELNMEIAEFVLESAGANVIKAFNGKEAVEIFKESKPGEINIILMDVMMPVMNGLEATRYIRWSNKENARDIPIIAMTANAFTEDRRQVLEAGMNEHLAKPLESEVLIEMIANYCGK